MSAQFNQMTDYFGLESSWLKLKSSDAGSGKTLTTVGANGGIVADFTTPKTFNPVCVYEVTGTGTLSVKLGKKAANANAMIVSVAVATSLGTPPQVTITATANEGADALHVFTFSTTVSPRHRAQNILSCVSGAGTDLQSCTVTASATPTVVMKNGAPIASDVTDARLDADVDIFGTSGSAGSEWMDTGDSVSCGGAQYRHTRRKFYKKMEAD